MPVKAHWENKVAGNLQAVGDELFLAFFKAHPEQQALFPKFANEKNLTGNAAFQAQTLVVMRFLQDVVRHIGTDALTRMHHKVNDHQPRNIGKDSFGKMFAFLPKFMASKGAEEAAWAAFSKEVMNECF